MFYLDGLEGLVQFIRALDAVEVFCDEAWPWVGLDSLFVEVAYPPIYGKRRAFKILFYYRPILWIPSPLPEAGTITGAAPMPWDDQGAPGGVVSACARVRACARLRELPISSAPYARGGFLIILRWK